MRKHLAALAALLVLPVGAHAAGGAGSVDLYFIPSSKAEITIPGFGSGSDKGTGFGVKGRVPVSESVTITGEYQSTSYDDDLDVDQFRVGFGLTGQTGSGLFVEYIDADVLDLAMDGFGVHGRLQGGAFYGQIGYLSLDDDYETNTGFEFAIGAEFPLGSALGGFIDLRRTAIEGEDSGIEFEVTDIRTGIRLQF